MSPTAVSALVAIPTTLLGYLIFLHSRKVDKRSEVSVALAQVTDGLNRLIDNLQEDNKTIRAEVRYCAERLAAVVLERDGLREELRQLHIKYGE